MVESNQIAKGDRIIGGKGLHLVVVTALQELTVLEMVTALGMVTALKMVTALVVATVKRERTLGKGIHKKTKLTIKERE